MAGSDNLDPSVIWPNRLLLGHAKRHTLITPVKARNTKEHIQMVEEMEMAFQSTWT